MATVYAKKGLSHLTAVNVLLAMILMVGTRHQMEVAYVSSVPCTFTLANFY